ADAEGFFPGGINNVRIWKTALGTEEIHSSRTEIQVDSADPDLALELPFDDDHPVDANH
ncbi:MAG: hypothetical protein GWO24_07145, partial [Akkermansiaceae bacterium]|nr:hypothetical protein [Akkermansiaceae bacterium]